MKLNVISAYETSAQDFFEQLEAWHVDMVVDIRLHNTNQLSGFTKLHDIVRVFHSPYPQRELRARCRILPRCYHAREVS